MVEAILHGEDNSYEKSAVKAITSHLAMACHWVIFTETESGTRVVHALVTLIQRCANVIFIFFYFYLSFISIASSMAMEEWQRVQT